MNNQKLPLDRETAWELVQADLLSLSAYIQMFGY